MSKIAIVYHSGFGHTAVLAESIAAGARAVAGSDVTAYKADDLASPDKGPWAEVAAADAIIFGAPTYMGSLSAPFKQFMDASSKVWYGDALEPSHGPARLKRATTQAHHDTSKRPLKRPTAPALT